MTNLILAPEVQAAFANGQPVVALESTVISHGLPYPHNREIALQLEATVRAAGAVPATIAVIQGAVHVGLTNEQIEHFATAKDVLKLSRRDIGYAVANGRDGATTVAATMAIAGLAGIQVFATGGIGGVHRGARESWDVSADLGELGKTPVLVVCAGAKSILDLPASLEVLETYGVPVVGYTTEELPAFYSAHSGLHLGRKVDDAAQAAATWAAHRVYGGGSGMVLAVPPPVEKALDPQFVEAAIGRAIAQADAAGIRGAAVTPFLLSAMARETEGESIATNTALLNNNAQIAAQVAVALFQSV
ncbi:pseudouridine-5'-phosphate glycosidase [Herpetosiphon geysericola]|uniref:Pseudouridine-5'-phosphate glycosidase n=1 Tax=Herpetosiphon geysericola TaxID=70996 RepID=A0A0P6XYV6_9CHLR|nr:pseudouridine-5'-phosphate glycosidase [Herpetosiphon geysericola]KPL88800.1 pseudouridine-5'-phosphate glycosidase [Herpetosiphon geysericola]